MNYFITAIHTDSGKTFVSAIFCRALKADYWKPVQAGAPSDSEKIRELLSDSQCVIHPESYRFKTAASPHAAARIEGITIEMDKIKIPVTSKDLIIEGAGGCLVPLNDSDFIIDIASKFKCKVILVSNTYLGSINHTLLTYEALIKRNIEIVGLVFNGKRNLDTEKIILQHTGLQCLLIIDEEEAVTRDQVRKYALKLNESWNR